MDNILKEELLELIRNIKMHLEYQKSLGAFVYGSDISEEMLQKIEEMKKFERITNSNTPSKIQDKSHSYLEMDLFEGNRPKMVGTEEDVSKGKKVCLSTDEKTRLLSELINEIGQDCKRCDLGYQGRSKVVFGEGNVDAKIMFVGEGPGEDEDIQGLPFVGRAGQLLTRIIKAMGLERSDVYIANVVKCRPPNNRTPLPKEMDVCGVFLRRQIRIIMPEVIIALGATAASYLLQDYKIKISQVRAHQLVYKDGDLIVPMVATFHPSYVLRKGESAEVKREVWKDITLAMKIVGMEVKR